MAVMNPPRAHPLRNTGRKLAFYPGSHPPFEYDMSDQGGSIAQADQDNTQWAGAYRGSVDYPGEISANNRPSPLFPNTASQTEYVWGEGAEVNGGVFGRAPLSSRHANNNFFASDPMQFGSVGGGFVSGMSGGGGMTLDGAVPAGGFAFLTPGTITVRPVYRQQIKGGLFPTMTTKDLQASTIYNPIPVFGTLVPKLP